MNMRPVLYVIGALLSTLALSMTIPMAVDLYAGNPDWKNFLLCIIFTGFFGGALLLSNASTSFTLTVKQAFLLTTLSWVTLAAFGAAPFYFADLNMSMTDAFFESVSGITTTGSTVMTNVETAPPGILLWRAILQWLGGIGIIVMALSILPFLKVGGMQLFRTESSENEKALPRATKLASAIGLIYVGLTILCMVCYTMSGLNSFDALAHAMTTIATGGFSTFNTSFGNFDTGWTETVAIIFMIMGALPFVLYLKALRGNWKSLFRDTQVRWFLYIITTSVIVMISYLVFHNVMDFEDALRKSIFNIVSVITGTGYTNGDYSLWGGFAVSVLFFLMVVGGCAGSTTCGIKIFRFQVLYSVAVSQLRQLLHPNGVFMAQYNGKALPEGVATSVMSFFFLYSLSFTMIAIALSYVGLDFLTAMSGAVTSISNVGPGLGDTIGPGGTFEPLPDAAKWILCIGMILGRLELFTVLVFFLPAFWRN